MEQTNSNIKQNWYRMYATAVLVIAIIAVICISARSSETYEIGTCPDDGVMPGGAIFQHEFHKYTSYVAWARYNCEIKTYGQ